MKANFSAQRSLPRNMFYFAKEEMLLGRMGYVGAICVLVSLHFHLTPQIKICALYGCSESYVVEFCSPQFHKGRRPILRGRYSDEATDWTSQESEFDFPRGRRFIFPDVSAPGAQPSSYPKCT